MKCLLLRFIALGTLVGTLVLGLSSSIGQVAAGTGERTPVVVALSLPKVVYKPGERLSGTITLTNTAKKPWFTFPLTFDQAGHGGYLGLIVKGPTGGATVEGVIVGDSVSSSAPSLSQLLDRIGVRVYPGDFYGTTKDIGLRLDKPGTYSIEVEYLAIRATDEAVEEVKSQNRIPLVGVYRSAPVVVRVVKK